MKRVVNSLFALWVFSATAGRASEIKPGNSLDEVYAALGNPQGYIVSGDYRLLYYERGKVEFRNNQVVAADLISSEEAVVRRVEAQRQARIAQQIEEERRLTRISEGTALRELKRTDAAFLSSPASYKVAFWQSFQRLYPEVSVQVEYQAALRQQQLDAIAQQKVLALEREVAAAEERARIAEAKDERTRAPVCYYPYTPYVVYYSKPCSAYVKKCEKKTQPVLSTKPTISISLNTGYAVCKF